jgi:DNA polymerase-3 subunit epsilon
VELIVFFDLSLLAPGVVARNSVQIETHEGDSLVDVATHWGLSFERVKAIHFEYLSQLAKAAWADRHITDAEEREIQMAGQLLGFGILSDEQLHGLMASTETILSSDSGVPPVEDWTGKTVCFTGECSCFIQGQLISREMAEQIAAGKALRVLPSVTMANLGKHGFNQLCPLLHVCFEAQFHF